MPVFSLYCPKILIWWPSSGTAFSNLVIFLPLMKKIILIFKESSTWNRISKTESAVWLRLLPPNSDYEAGIQKSKWKQGLFPFLDGILLAVFFPRQERAFQLILSRRVEIKILIWKKLGRRCWGGINSFRKNSKLGIEGFFGLSKSCTGELDVLKYRAAHSKGTFIPPPPRFFVLH